MLHGKRDFADIIKVLDLKIGRLSRIIQISLDEPLKAENFLCWSQRDAAEVEVRFQVEEESHVLVLVLKPRGLCARAGWREASRVTASMDVGPYPATMVN